MEAILSKPPEWIKPVVAAYLERDRGLWVRILSVPDNPTDTKAVIAASTLRIEIKQLVEEITLRVHHLDEHFVRVERLVDEARVDAPSDGSIVRLFA
jgi:hypothetical protein